MGRFACQFSTRGKGIKANHGVRHDRLSCRVRSPITIRLFVTDRVSIALVSIQGLVLVREPYFCEPSFERMRGTEEGTLNSRLYKYVTSLDSFLVCQLKVGIQREGICDGTRVREACSGCTPYGARG